MFGGRQNDRINDLFANDTLSGGLGNDRLIGGTGNNLLQGGEGGDAFVFQALNAQDTVTDFELGVDQIDLSHFLEGAGSISIEMNGLNYTRLNNFDTSSETALFDRMTISVVQLGDDIAFYFTHLKDPAHGATPFVTIENLNVADLSFADFMF